MIAATAPTPSTEPPAARAVGQELAAWWGPRVAAQRIGAAVSQAALARRCGVTQQTISKIERGSMVPLDPLKLRLATELGTTPGQLFAWPDGVGGAGRSPVSGR